MVLSEGSIWEAAVTECRRRKAHDVEERTGDSPPSETTLLLVGPRGAGKTTIKIKFLDREEVPKPTLALDYTYARKSGKTTAKDVCHIWEVGGGAAYSSLLSTPITHRNVVQLTAMVVLDLSAPQNLWMNLQILIKDISDRINKVIQNQRKVDLDLEKLLTERAWKRFGQDHTDKDKINPSLIPLVIIGGKYDIFRDMEPDKVKTVCRALRHFAHVNGADLLFFSSKEAGLVKKIKELMNHYAFGTAEVKSLSQDHNTPLIIPAGSDSLQQIQGSGEETVTLDSWRHVLDSMFPQQEKEKNILPEDPSKDPNYAEPDIDNLRAQKAQELERWQRQVGHRGGFQDLDATS